MGVPLCKIPFSSSKAQEAQNVGATGQIRGQLHATNAGEGLDEFPQQMIGG